VHKMETDNMCVRELARLQRRRARGGGWRCRGETPRPTLSRQAKQAQKLRRASLVLWACRCSFASPSRSLSSPPPPLRSPPPASLAPPPRALRTNLFCACIIRALAGTSRTTRACATTNPSTAWTRTTK
jgi:hypothetical protein